MRPRTHGAPRRNIMSTIPKWFKGAPFGVQSHRWGPTASWPVTQDPREFLWAPPAPLPPE